MDILDKINSSLYSHDEIRDMEIVLEMAMLIDDSVVMNEAFDLSALKTGGKALMKAAGIHAGKSGDGLIQIALKSGKLMAEFVWHILKAAAGNEQSKIRVKEIANTQITKEQFLDFLYKLDMATMHLVTGPLHLLDAWTGWHVAAALKHGTDDMLKKAKEALANLLDAAKGTADDVKKKLVGYMHGIAKLFGIEGVHKQIQAI